MIKPFISKACSFYLKYQNYPQVLVYQALSGLGENRLGRYYECLQQPQSQYFLIEAHQRSNQLVNSKQHLLPSTNCQNSFSKYLQNNFTTGFCFNKACSAKDLAYGLQSVSKYVFLPFQIDNVISPAQILPKYDAWTYVTLSIIIFLLFCCLISTALKIYFKKIKYKQQHMLIECFSLQNTIRLLSYHRNNLYDEIRVFSGIKFISFLGILFSHMLILLLKAPSTQFKQNTVLLKFFILFYSSDIWLMISGFFLSYISLKQFRQYKSIRIHLLRIVRRFLRFWPLYIIIVMFTWKIAPFIGNGPLWGYAVQFFESQCGAEFNFSSNSCNSWLWLWQIDIQLCIFFTPLLLLYCKFKSMPYKYLFFGIQIILLVGSILIPSLIQQDEPINKYFANIQLNKINISPIARVGSYMVGYNMGIYFFEFRNNHPIQKSLTFRLMSRRIIRVIIALGSFVALGMMAYYISSFKANMVTFKDRIIFSSFHFIFPLVFCLLISPPLFGFHSWFKILLSKLSMSAYGVHFIVQVAIIYSRKTDLYLNNFQILLTVLYSFLPIFVISVFFTALLQMPLYVAKKIYLKTPRITYFQH